MGDGPATTREAVKRPGVRDIIEGLLLFDEPILNSRYHAILYEDPIPERRDALARLPGLVIESHRLAHRTVDEWPGRAGTDVTRKFILQGQRAILESFLTLAENELRMIAFMARSAPTVATRAPFDEMAAIHREVCDVLRDVLENLSMGSEAEPPDELRSVQEETPHGDLRSQIETAIRARWRAQRGIRRVIVSHTAQRHLRDQGCFADGDPTILGVPVAIDLSWGTPAFAIEGFDIVPLEEIMTSAEYGADE